jgi:HPr kinase/phosphorylase
MSKYSVQLSKIIRSENFSVIYLPKKPEDIYVSCIEVYRPGLILASHDNNFGSDRIQFLGNSEIKFLMDMSAQDRDKSLDRFFAEKPVTVVISNTNVEYPEEITGYAEKYEVPLLQTKEQTSYAISSLVSYLNVELAERITRHGVLVEVSGEGVLIVGDSGVGKSETVVELIKRGHRLVADDAVEIRKVSSKTLVGSSPDNIRHFIELRGIGIVDARRLFGMSAVKMTVKIDMVIELEPWDDEKAYERMGLNDEHTNILGVDVPLCIVPVSPGRNLAVIVEVAAINNRLKKMGYNSAKELLKSLGMLDEDFEDESTDVDIWHNT